MAQTFDTKVYQENLAGTSETLMTYAAGGVQLVGIDIKSEAATTAGELTLFLFDGANEREWKTIPVTTEAAAPYFSYTFTDPLLIFNTAGYELRVQLHEAVAYNFAVKTKNLGQ